MVAQSPPHQVNGLSDSNPTVSTQYVFDRAGSLDSGMPRSIRELERDGRISVELFNVLMPATLEDGSPAVIPVQEMRLGRGRLESY